MWTKADIIEDNNLLKLYETKIPVLKRVDNNLEICWPFRLQDIIELMN